MVRGAIERRLLEVSKKAIFQLAMFLFYIVANHADGTCCIEIKRHTITPPVGWDRLPFCKTAQRLNPPSMMFNQWSMNFFFSNGVRLRNRRPHPPDSVSLI